MDHRVYDTMQYVNVLTESLLHFNFIACVYCNVTIQCVTITVLLLYKVYFNYIACIVSIEKNNNLYSVLHIACIIYVA